MPRCWTGDSPGPRRSATPMGNPLSLPRAERRRMGSDLGQPRESEDSLVARARAGSGIGDGRALPPPQRPGHRLRHQNDRRPRPGRRDLRGHLRRLLRTPGPLPGARGPGGVPAPDRPGAARRRGPGPYSAGPEARRASAEDPGRGEPIDPAPGPAEAIASAEQAGLAGAALSKLSPPLREVVVLRIYQGLDYATIASIVGAGEPTVRSRMRYALQSLRRSMEASRDP